MDDYKEYSLAVVEDDKPLRELYRDIFTARFGRIEIFCDGREALDGLRKKPVDLVITDIKMPKLDGIGLVEHISQENLASLTILATGFGNRDDIKRALLANVYDFIEKPVNIDVLINRVSRAMDAIISDRLKSRALTLLLRHLEISNIDINSLSNAEQIKCLKRALELFNVRLTKLDFVETAKTEAARTRASGD